MSDNTFPPALPLDLEPTDDPTPDPMPTVNIVECADGEIATPTDDGYLCTPYVPEPGPSPVYTQPGFRDEDGNGCPDGLVPNPNFIKGSTAEACISAPRELAETGPGDDLLGFLLTAACFLMIAGFVAVGIRWTRS